MPFQSPGAVHAVDVPLSNLSIAIYQEEERFVAGKVFPDVPSAQKSNRYYIWTRDDMFRTDAVKRGAGAALPRIKRSLSTDTYSCDDWGVGAALDNQTRANADPALNLEEAALRSCITDVLIRREVDWVSSFFGTSIWNADTTVGVQWENANSIPIEDVRGRAYVMQTNTGRKPNTFVIGPNVEKRLLDHPDIVDRIKYTQAATGAAVQQILAAMFGVDRLMVIGASRNTAVEGAAGSFSNIAGNHALLLYVDPNPSLLSPTAGLTFWWTGLYPAMGPSVYRYYEDQTRSDVVEVEMPFDHKVVSAVLGEFFSSAVGS